jgi:site-specific recombinase XerD
MVAVGCCLAEVTKLLPSTTKTKAAITKLAPHDLRRSCAKLCHVAGGELEQIQFLLGHVSVETTERYLGCRQRLKNAVNDCIGIEPQDGTLYGGNSRPRG